MFLKESDVVAQCVLKAREDVDAFEGKSDARVGVRRQHAHGYEHFGAIGNYRSSALVILSELSFPLLNVGKDISKPSGSLWRHDGFVGSMQLRFTPGANGHYNAAPGIESITRFDVVERYLFFAV